MKRKAITSKKRDRKYCKFKECEKGMINEVLELITEEAE